MLKITLITVTTLIVVFLIVVALQPAKFRVARSTAVNAPPVAAYAQVDELKKWEGWNPWGKIDPAMKLSYEGPASGVGASYAWAGNNQVGEGRATITASRPNEAVQLRLDFFKPFAGTNTAEFTFKPEGDHTIVTWTMEGSCNFMAKAIHLFIDMDKMIGSQFEKGLADLKAIAEAVPVK